MTVSAVLDDFLLLNITLPLSEYSSSNFKFVASFLPLLFAELYFRKVSVVCIISQSDKKLATPQPAQSLAKSSQAPSSFISVSAPRARFCARRARVCGSLARTCGRMWRGQSCARTAREYRHNLCLCCAPGLSARALLFPEPDRSDGPQFPSSLPSTSVRTHVSNAYTLDECGERQWRIW